MDIASVKQSETLSRVNRGLVYMLGMHGIVFRSRPILGIVREMRNRCSLPIVTVELEFLHIFSGA